MYEIIADEKEDKATQAKNERFVNNALDSLIDFRNATNTKKNPEMKIPVKLLILLKKSSTLTNNKKVRNENNNS